MHHDQRDIIDNQQKRLDGVRIFTLHYVFLLQVVAAYGAGDILVGQG